MKSALQSTYYTHRKNQAPTGSLYAKYRNWKKKLNSSAKTASEPKRKQAKRSHPSFGTFEVAADEQKHMEIIRDEFEMLSWEEKLKHWRACAPTRLNAVRAKDGTKQIAQMYPMYNDPYGFRLVIGFHFNSYFCTVTNIGGSIALGG